VLREVLADPEAAVLAQSDYRDWIDGEKDRYEVAVDLWLETALAK
jgi:hypothetical protein